MKLLDGQQIGVFAIVSGMRLVFATTYGPVGASRPHDFSKLDAVHEKKTSQGKSNSMGAFCSGPCMDPIASDDCGITLLPSARHLECLYVCLRFARHAMTNLVRRRNKLPHSKTRFGISETVKISVAVTESMVADLAGILVWILIPSKCRTKSGYLLLLRCVDILQPSCDVPQAIYLWNTPCQAVCSTNSISCGCIGINVIEDLNFLVMRSNELRGGKSR